MFGGFVLRREAEPLPSRMEFIAACFCLQVLRRLIKKTYADWGINWKQMWLHYVGRKIGERNVCRKER
jgi:hypothetical protein